MATKTKKRTGWTPAEIKQMQKAVTSSPTIKDGIDAYAKAHHRSFAAVNSKFYASTQPAKKPAAPVQRPMLTKTVPTVDVKLPSDTQELVALFQAARQEIERRHSILGECIG